MLTNHRLVKKKAIYYDPSFRMVMGYQYGHAGERKEDRWITWHLSNQSPHNSGLKQRPVCCCPYSMSLWVSLQPNSGLLTHGYGLSTETVGVSGSYVSDY